MHGYSYIIHYAERCHKEGDVRHYATLAQEKKDRV
jgi:hypothetical protein